MLNNVECDSEVLELTVGLHCWQIWALAINSWWIFQNTLQNNSQVKITINNLKLNKVDKNQFLGGVIDPKLWGKLKLKLLHYCIKQKHILNQKSLQMTEERFATQKHHEDEGKTSPTVINSFIHFHGFINFKTAQI